MGSSPQRIAEIISLDQELSHRYEQVFGEPAKNFGPMDVVVNVAKAMAAFQATIVTGKTSFDRFRDALARNDLNEAGKFPLSAQRGAALFVGRGRCHLCHIGARFTSDEFDDVGMPYFTGPAQVDRGRFQGIKQLRTSAFNLLGDYNDSPEKVSGWATKNVAQTHKTFGQFKVPSLRQLTHTGPYMHDGSLETLRDVINHYSNLDQDRIHSDAFPVLEPLNLSEQETDDLLEFLKSLSTPLSSK